MVLGFPFGGYPYEVIQWFVEYLFPQDLWWLTQALWFVYDAAFLTTFFTVNLIMIIWLERKVVGKMMHRKGPTFIDFNWPIIGKIGLLQNIADFLKFLGKEDIIPEKADRFGYEASMFLILGSSLAALSMIPVYAVDYLDIEGVEGVVSNPAVGILFIFALFGLYPIGVLVAAWSSNNKFSIIGGFRSAAQLISYEIPYILAVIGVIMWVGSFSLVEIANAQVLPNGFWFIFLMPLGFVIFVTSMVAETERIPFDLPEAEAELVMGWRTEFSGWRYMMWMASEYIHLLVNSMLAVVLFLGGWNVPIVSDMVPDGAPLAIFQFVVLFTKIYILLYILIWIRGSLPRVRIDQLLHIGWKRLIPLSIVNFAWILVIMVVTGRIELQ